MRIERSRRVDLGDGVGVGGDHELERRSEKNVRFRKGRKRREDGTHSQKTCQLHVLSSPNPFLVDSSNSGVLSRSSLPSSSGLDQFSSSGSSSDSVSRVGEVDLVVTAREGGERSRFDAWCERAGVRCEEDAERKEYMYLVSTCYTSRELRRGKDAQEEEDRGEAGNRPSFPRNSHLGEGGPDGGVGRDKEWRSILCGDARRRDQHVERVEERKKWVARMLT